MKRIVALLAAVAMLLTVTACTPGNTGDLPSSAVSNPIVPPSDISDTDPSSDRDPSSESSSRPSSSRLDSSVAGPSSSLGAEGPEEEVFPHPDPTDEFSAHAAHYCYSMLTDRQKEYYEAMYGAVTEMQLSWVALGPADKDYKTDVAVVRNALANDHPGIFWLPSYYATALGTDASGHSTALIYFSVSLESDPSYLILRSEKARMEQELRQAVTAITGQVTASDPYEIELQLHDLLCQRVDYSAQTSDPMIFTAYGALVNGKALCEGYSRAMQLLLNEFGIRSVTVTGVANNEGHMWNAVELDGEWYHLDATWNDTKGSSVSHEYFNLNDSLISLDHTFNKNYDQFDNGVLESGTVLFNTHRPICDGTEYNYFNRSGFVFFPDGIAALTAYLVRESSDSVEVRFSNTGFRDKFYSDPNRYILQINELLSSSYPDCGFYIGGFSVSSSVLRLYKKPTKAEPVTPKK